MANNLTIPAGLTLEMMHQWAPAAQKVADAIAVGKVGLSAADKAHNEAAAATVATSVREYAAATEAAGIAPVMANAILRQNLILAGVPIGTALNYGRAVEGFRQIKANGGNPDKASVRDAQQIMRTDETKARDDLRDKLRPMIRDASVSQLSALLEYAQGLGIVVKDRQKRSDAGNGGQTAEQPAVLAKVA